MQEEAEAEEEDVAEAKAEEEGVLVRGGPRHYLERECLSRVLFQSSGEGRLIHDIGRL